MWLIGTDFIDPDDPTYIAEHELFNAAQSIESAARKLSSLKPRRKLKVIREKNLSQPESVVMICCIFGCSMPNSTEYYSYLHNLSPFFF